MERLSKKLFKYKSHEIIQQFSKHTLALRQHFENVFSKDVPPEQQQKRFCWDYWFVKNQYQFLRTPADLFFPAKILKPVYEDLISYGQKNLGCHGITPLWLSLYTNGARQEFHCDKPHGPWAFVLPLTADKIKFSGGETKMKLSSGNKKIKPKAHQLLVFDPQIEHGVVPVENAVDPLQSRLVLHGWFVMPQIFLHGSLSIKKVNSVIQNMTVQNPNLFSATQDYFGSLCLCIEVKKSGFVSDVKILTNTLQSKKENLQSWYRGLEKNLLLLRFPKSNESSRIIFPLVFRG